MNIISFLCTVPMVVITELQTLPDEWNAAVAKHGTYAIIYNIVLSGFCFYIYNEFAFAFTAQVGAVTSSVLNTAKRVIIIVVSAGKYISGLVAMFELFSGRWCAARM